MTAIPDRRLALLILLLLGLWLAMMLLGGSTSSADLYLLHAFRQPALDRAALIVTRLGNAYVLLPLSLIATVAIAWRVGRRPGARLSRPHPLRAASSSSSKSAGRRGAGRTRRGGSTRWCRWPSRARTRPIRWSPGSASP